MPRGGQGPALLEEMRVHKAALLALCACAAGTPAPAVGCGHCPGATPARGGDVLALQQRHEPLRTAARGEQGKVLQPIESVAVLPWQVTDLDALALAQRLEKARRQAACRASIKVRASHPNRRATAAHAAQLPLDLQRALPWRLAGDD